MPPMDSSIAAFLWRWSACELLPTIVARAGSQSQMRWPRGPLVAKNLPCMALKNYSSAEEASLSDSLVSHMMAIYRHMLQAGCKGAQIRDIIATLLRCVLPHGHLTSIHFKNWLALEKATVSAVGTFVFETNEIARISGDS